MFAVTLSLKERSGSNSAIRVEPCLICTPEKSYMAFQGFFNTTYKMRGCYKMSEMNELQILRHSASHVLAQAVKRLFPDVKLAIGPAVDNGFYYDFDSEIPFTQDVLSQIEAEMKKIVKENLKLNL